MNYSTSELHKMHPGTRAPEWRAAAEKLGCLLAGEDGQRRWFAVAAADVPRVLDEIHQAKGQAPAPTVTPVKASNKASATPATKGRPTPAPKSIAKELSAAEKRWAQAQAAAEKRGQK